MKHLFVTTDVDTGTIFGAGHTKQESEIATARYLIDNVGHGEMPFSMDEALEHIRTERTFDGYDVFPTSWARVDADKIEDVTADTEYKICE